MWVFFEPTNGQTAVTIKRPTEGINTRLVKSWMVDLAGRLEALMPIEFKEDPPLREAQARGLRISHRPGGGARDRNFDEGSGDLGTHRAGGIGIAARVGGDDSHRVARRASRHVACGKCGGGQTTPGKTDAGI